MQQDRNPPWQRGDLVEYLPDGTRWTVDAYWAGSPYKQPEVTIGQDSAEEGPGYRQVHAVIQSVHPDQVKLIVPWQERPIWPGDDWSHLVLEDGS